jgi:hypothetical protein
MEIGRLVKKGIKYIHLLNKILIDYVKKIGKKEELCKNGLMIYMWLSKKDGEFRGMKVEIIPYALLCFGLMT